MAPRTASEVADQRADGEAAIEAEVTENCLRQGLPPKVTDAATVARLALLLTTRQEAR